MLTKARLKDDGTVVEILRDGSERPLPPQVDWARVDATTEEEIAGDQAEPRRDVAAYGAVSVARSACRGLPDRRDIYSGSASKISPGPAVDRSETMMSQPLAAAIRPLASQGWPSSLRRTSPSLRSPARASSP